MSGGVGPERDAMIVSSDHASGGVGPEREARASIRAGAEIALRDGVWAAEPRAVARVMLGLLAELEAAEKASAARIAEVEAALQKSDRVFAAMIDFAERFVDDNPEGRIGVLSRRVMLHSIEARELIADAVLAGSAARPEREPA